MSLVSPVARARSRRPQKEAQASRPDVLTEGASTGGFIDNLPSSSGFSALLSAYRSTGGTTRGDDLARMLVDHGRGDFVSLAKLIASNTVFGFPWRSNLWIPMFQFEARDLSMTGGLPGVLKALGSEFDAWARAAWFVNRHAELGGRRPVDLLVSDPTEVLRAARSDRAITIEQGITNPPAPCGERPESPSIAT